MQRTSTSHNDPLHTIFLPPFACAMWFKLAQNHTNAYETHLTHALAIVALKLSKCFNYSFEATWPQNLFKSYDATVTHWQPQSSQLEQCQKWIWSYKMQESTCSSLGTKNMWAHLVYNLASRVRLLPWGWLPIVPVNIKMLGKSPIQRRVGT